MTKAAGEKLVLNADSNNVVCRYGNVLGSRGSILPALVRSLKKHKRAYITDARMTRFWLPIDTVAEFVGSCGMDDGFAGLMIPEMQSSKVTDLIHATAELLDVPTFQMQDIGIRPGEKIHEHLETEHENGRRDITSGDEDRLIGKDALKELIGRYICTL
jgi:FlaA1/EpsC-like NDP-sugar epimerase